MAGGERKYRGWIVRNSGGPMPRRGPVDNNGRTNEKLGRKIRTEENKKRDQGRPNRQGTVMKRSLKSEVYKQSSKK